MTVRGALIDLDGTLYSRGEAIPGAADAIRALRRRGLTLRFLTNTDSRPATQVLNELAAMGLEIEPAELLTPIAAAKRLLPADASVYALVAAPVLAAFSEWPARDPITHVVVGDCRERLTYATLDRAFQAVHAGAELIALQQGRYFQAADGDHLDAGALVAAVEYATNRTATLAGKPSEAFFAAGLASAGTKANETVVVGDDQSSDVVGGRAVGAITVQVRTGKGATPSDADHVIDSIADLPGLVQGI